MLKQSKHKIRSETTMMALILNTALADERIRAVIMNGSRVNPNVLPDRFQDYDVIYIVTDLASFLADPTWIDRFGERMILQLPDLMGAEAPREDGGFTYLMQFMDGNRIDLTLIPVTHTGKMQNDSLSVLLLDKDQRFDPFPPPSEDSYLPTPPTPKDFADCCNEFWWVSPYVAKALKREEILYARHLLDTVLRQELMRMLTWWFGIKTSFQHNPGKMGKHFKDMLSAEHWEQLLSTYSPAEINPTWGALFRMADLFREMGCEVAQNLGYSYPEEDDNRVRCYLKEIQTGTN